MLCAINPLKFNYLVNLDIQLLLLKFFFQQTFDASSVLFSGSSLKKAMI